VSRLALLVPARNAVGHLPRLLDSVERQTVPFDEVWLFDDASDDRTGAAAEARGVRVVRSETQVGPSAGKNRLAELTSCDWVHFHDADDALESEFVARARDWMARDEADVVLFCTEDRDPVSGAKLLVTTWDDGAVSEDPVAYAIRRTITNCGIYRRQAFLAAGGFVTRRTFQYNEDQAMHLQLALSGLRFRASDYVGVVIHRHPGSMSSGHPVECARANVEVMADTARRTGRRYRDEIGSRLWQLAGVCGSYGDWSSVDRCLAVSRELGYDLPVDEHWAVRTLARVNPRMAVRVREGLIRLFKPGLRTGVPRATDVGVES